MNSREDNKATGRVHRNIIEELGGDNIYGMLKECFARTEKIKYGDLQIYLKGLISKAARSNTGDNKIKEVFSHSKANGWIIQEKDYAPYTLGSLGKSV